MLTTIHLPTSDSFQLQNQPNISQIISDAFIESCKALDASIFEPYMDEEGTFENKNKYLFLADLKALFDSYKEENLLSISVSVEDGTCTGCKNGIGVKVFKVKGWGRIIFSDRFAYVIERKNGVLKDIYRCNLFCKIKEGEV